MQFQDMLTAVNTLIDDIMDATTVASWLNMGKDVMAQMANAAFPDINPNDPTSTWVFDPKWHQIPVLYAAAKYKEQDTAIQEVSNFYNQFQTLSAQFAEKYAVPPVYMDTAYSQQFGKVPVNPNGMPLFASVTALFPNANAEYTAVGPDYANDPQYSQTVIPQTYSITKDSFLPYKAQLRVYVNNQQIPNTFVTDNGDGSFTISPAYTVQTTDQITAVWNQVDDEIAPPYAWWTYE